MMSRLPMPFRSDESPNESETSKCDELGRVRSYAHERGQWTTHVFLPVPQASISNLIDSIVCKTSNLHEIEAPHVSLSRRHFVLRYHHIKAFVDDISKKFSIILPLKVCLSKVQLLFNDERTRGFVCLCQSDMSPGFQQLGETLKQTQLQYGTTSDTDFNEDFIIHASLYWFLPNYENEARLLADELQAELDEEPIVLNVETVSATIGHQSYVFQLFNNKV